MNPTMAANGAKPAVRRARNSVPLATGNSKEAKRLAAAILEVLAGARTPQQAAEALQLSLPRYYQIEARGQQALLSACEAKPKGRQPDPRREVAVLQGENERLRRELTRQQTLARLAQRSLGLAPPPPASPKTGGKKNRKRKPTVRALTLSARLREEAVEMPGAGLPPPASSDGPGAAKRPGE
jgi:hypothetical protein